MNQIKSYLFFPLAFLAMPVFASPLYELSNKIGNLITEYRTEYLIVCGAVIGFLVIGLIGKYILWTVTRI